MTAAKESQMLRLIILAYAAALFITAAWLVIAVGADIAAAPPIAITPDGKVGVVMP